MRLIVSLICVLSSGELLDATPTFEEKSKDLGITPANGPSAWIDFDRDGWVDLHSVTGFEISAHGFTQYRDTGRRCVTVVSVTQCFDRSFHDVCRCFEIRLSDAEVDDVSTLTRQCFGMRQYLERRFGAQSLHPGGC